MQRLRNRFPPLRHAFDEAERTCALPHSRLADHHCGVLPAPQQDGGYRLHLGRHPLHRVALSLPRRNDHVATEARQLGKPTVASHRERRNFLPGARAIPTRGEGESGQVQLLEPGKRRDQPRPPIPSPRDGLEETNGRYLGISVLVEGERPCFPKKLRERLVERGQDAGRPPRLVHDRLGKSRLRGRGIQSGPSQCPRKLGSDAAVAQERQNVELEADAAAPVPCRSVRHRMENASGVRIQVFVEFSQIHG